MNGPDTWNGLLSLNPNLSGLAGNAFGGVDRQFASPYGASPYVSVVPSLVDNTPFADLVSQPTDAPSSNDPGFNNQDYGDPNSGLGRATGLIGSVVTSLAGIPGPAFGGVFGGLQAATAANQLNEALSRTGAPPVDVTTQGLYGGIRGGIPGTLGPLGALANMAANTFGADPVNAVMNAFGLGTGMSMAEMNDRTTAAMANAIDADMEALGIADIAERSPTYSPTRNDYRQYFGMNTDPGVTTDFGMDQGWGGPANTYGGFSAADAAAQGYGGGESAGASTGSGPGGTSTDSSDNHGGGGFGGAAKGGMIRKGPLSHYIKAKGKR